VWHQAGAGPSGSRCWPHGYQTGVAICILLQDMLSLGISSKHGNEATREGMLESGKGKGEILLSAG